MFHRRSVRLNGFDYSQNGWYFVTVCTFKRLQIFGEIKNSKMITNMEGKIVESAWRSLPGNFNIKLGPFQIMPDHFHGIIVFEKSCRGGAIPALNIFHGDTAGREDRAPTLGQVIAYFKYQTTKEINPLHVYNRIWQRNYYEHIIRNEKQFYAIQQYIIENPKNWANDTREL